MIYWTEICKEHGRIVRQVGARRYRAIRFVKCPCPEEHTDKEERENTDGTNSHPDDAARP